MRFTFESCVLRARCSIGHMGTQRDLAREGCVGVPLFFYSLMQCRFAFYSVLAEHVEALWLLRIAIIELCLSSNPCAVRASSA
jgi:hypothetical protein